VPLLICKLHNLASNLAGKFMLDPYVPKIDLDQVMTDEQVEKLKNDVLKPTARKYPTDVDYGEGFTQHLGKIHLGAEELNSIRRR